MEQLGFKPRYPDLRIHSPPRCLYHILPAWELPEASYFPQNKVRVSCNLQLNDLIQFCKEKEGPEKKWPIPDQISHSPLSQTELRGYFHHFGYIPLDSQSLVEHPPPNPPAIQTCFKFLTLWFSCAKHLTLFWPLSFPSPGLVHAVPPASHACPLSLPIEHSTS